MTKKIAINHAILKFIKVPLMNWYYLFICIQIPARYDIVIIHFENDMTA